MLPLQVPSFFVRVLPFIFTISILVPAALRALFPGSDPYRCEGLMQNGTWLNTANPKNDSRQPFTNWQPDGCMLSQYKKEDIHDCIEDGHIVVSGDSTTRQIFWALGRLLDREASLAGRETAGIHESYDMEFDGIRMLQLWNPYLTTGPDGNSDLTLQLEAYADYKREQANAGKPSKATEKKEKQEEVEKQIETQEQIDTRSILRRMENYPSMGIPKPDKPAALTFVGAGSWYALRYYEETAIHDFTIALNNLTSVLHHDLYPNFGTQAMSPSEGVGPEVFIAPVATPFLDVLPKHRQGQEKIMPGEIEHLDEVLAGFHRDNNLRMIWAFPELSRNQKDAIVDLDDTGFHVIDIVAELKANILLNLRCNAKLDSQRGYPYDRTCCSDYGASTRPLIQTLAVALATVYVVICLLFEASDLYFAADANTPPRSNIFNLNIGIFFVAILFCFHADRTHLFAKGQKEFIANDFYLLLALAAVPALLTIRKSIARKPRNLPAGGATAATPMVEDQGVLSRDQTDEWKGWMQAVILIYHWTGASRYLPIYIFVRMLVAMYLFQTGYGHTIYFLTKKDFSFNRVAAVNLRINLLSCILPYFMGTDYMFYYFAPLITYWFIIIYATMAIGSKYNDNYIAVISKIAIMMVGLWLVMNWTPLFDWFFDILHMVFRIQWDLHEWKFRANLDGIVVFVGMLCGLVYTKIQRDSHWLFSLKTYAIPAAGTFFAYMYYSITIHTKKEHYNAWHPLLSWIPIVAFVVLRNAVLPLRNYYSKAAAWLGRCSLETFILQFHIFLAADTKGVLLLDAFRGGDGSLLGDRWRDLLVIVPIFLWVSSLVSDATGEIVKVMVTKPKEQAYDAIDSEDRQMGFIDNPKLLEGYKIPGLTKFISLSKTVGKDLRLQCAAILLGMWLLNIVSLAWVNFV